MHSGKIQVMRATRNPQTLHLNPCPQRLVQIFNVPSRSLRPHVPGTSSPLWSSHLEKLRDVRRIYCLLCCCCWVASVVSDSVRPHRRQPTRLPRPWDSPGKSTGVGCHFLLQCRKVKSESEVAQSCPTLSDPMNCSLPGSSVHGIFQARVLEWGATDFSNCLF